MSLNLCTETKFVDMVQSSIPCSKQLKLWHTVQRVLSKPQPPAKAIEALRSSGLVIPIKVTKKQLQSYVCDKISKLENLTKLKKIMKDMIMQLSDIQRKSLYLEGVIPLVLKLDEVPREELIKMGKETATRCDL